MLLVTVTLAVSAAGLWLLVWTLVQRNRRDAWVSAAERLAVPVEQAVDGSDTSSIGKIRNWFGIPRVHVYLSKDSEVALLMRAPAGAPHAMLIHIERPISDDVLSRVAARFPNAEIRRPAGGLGGGGFF